MLGAAQLQRFDWRREDWVEDDGLEIFERILMEQRNQTRFLLTQEMEIVGKCLGCMQGQFRAT